MAPEAERQAQGPLTLPSGTVTFLFTDIEGSTQRWEERREPMQAAVVRHEQLLHAAITQHGGHVFKTVGDGFCSAFPTAPRAVEAAIAMQRALAAEDFSAVDGLRVRVGLHTGHAVERDGDYFGPTVNRVARLMSIGHGGQILMSQTTYDLTKGEVPSSASLLDLGRHRLKDLTEAERVTQVVVDGLPSAFPPLNSLSDSSNNLPVQLTGFHGRANEIADVKTLLDEHRLLTLVGSGGVGKTRLALQAGADLVDRFPNGVWFADMSPISDPELVASVVGAALRVDQVPGKRVDELIPTHLKRKKLLLIIDNCEHLLDAIARLVDAIHRSAPDVRILATSRQGLGVDGEVIHRVPSLTIPARGAALSAEEASQFGAVAVFVDRARRGDSRFTMTDDDVPTVIEICHHLDGIPLAIELAAARVSVLSIPNLARRLDERFKILTGGSRTALPRQKTLTALIDWSYDLLSPQEQLFFSRLGIFAGTFSLAAANDVCGDDPLDDFEVLDLLASLADKSLVVADASGRAERYYLLESTRAYALEKLQASDRDRLSRDHAEYFRDLARAADEDHATDHIGWLAKVEIDLDNYRTALEWSITRSNDAVIGAALAGMLGRLWLGAGLSVEGRYWIEQALERVSEDEHPRIVARLLRAQSVHLSASERVEAAQHAVRLSESLGDVFEASMARYYLALGLRHMGRYDEAETVSTQIIEVFSRTGDMWYYGGALEMKANIARARGDKAAARELFSQAIAGFRAMGDDYRTGLPLSGLAELEFDDGRPDEALRFMTEALEIRRNTKNKSVLANTHMNLAAYRLALGHVEAAREEAREALRLAREIQAPYYVAIPLQHLALAGALAGNVHDTAKIFGFVNARCDALGMRRGPTERWCCDKLMSVLREKSSDDEITRLGAEGAAWSEDQAVEVASKI